MLNRGSFFPTKEHDMHEYDRIMENLKAEQSRSKVNAWQKLQLLDAIDRQTETNILMDQYKMVASAYESVQQRRMSNNNVFVFVYSAIIGLYNFLGNEHVPLADTQLSYSTYVVFLIGMIVGAMWINMTITIIKSEREKYRQLQMFEDHLPLRVFSKLNEKYDKERKFLSARYVDLVLPLFMIFALAINFFLMLIS